MKSTTNGQSFSERDKIEKIKAYIRQNASSFLEDENISSIGIGYKIKGGKKTPEISIQFTVDQKIELENLEGLGFDPIPETISIDGLEIATDVLERRYDLSFQVIEEVADSARKVRVDPIAPGVSICNAKGTAGTAGCVVYDKDDDTPFILSNWHVLHGSDGHLADLIVQPGPHDDNRISLNKSGKLIRSHLGIAGDCAISSIEGRGFTEEIFKLNTRVRKLSEPELGDKVIKSGRTTDVTYGVVDRIHVIVSLNYGINIGRKEIGCFEIGVDENNLPPDGEISKGGDSGAVWLIAKNNKPSDIMAGLHFAGEGRGNPHEHALACYPKSVFDKLGIKTSKAKKVVKKANGFDTHFLSHPVPVPEINEPHNVYRKDGSTQFDYTHFSLAMHKKRKFAIWVAWNIDGGKIRKLSRKGIGFVLDPRIPSKYQIGNELYRNNDLDRGHIARRADLVWGTLAEARQANRDSFHYTNIAPQMNDFNQSSRGGIWGSLENEVFKEVDVDNLRISVIGGPIFQKDDQEYRGFQIPTEFYKVIFFEESGQLVAKAFLLTQNIDRLEVLDLDEFKVYEVSLSELEERCQFKFDSILHDAQMEATVENVLARQPITALNEIVWGNNLAGLL